MSCVNCLSGKGLTEAHDFAVALAAGREVRAALGAAHRQGGESIFEGLLETEEFQDREVHRSVETDAAFVRADGVVELHAVADVVLHFALVVKPGDAEGDDAVGLDHALDDFVAFEFGVLVVDVFYTHKNLADSLEVFFFTGVFGLEGRHDTVDVHV